MSNWSQQWMTNKHGGTEIIKPPGIKLTYKFWISGCMLAGQHWQHMTLCKWQTRVNWGFFYKLTDSCLSVCFGYFSVSVLVSVNF